jgi:hypothetical protein
MFTKICLVCSIEFRTYKEKQKTCSKICMGVSQKGSNNPNFGNKWSDAAKKSQGDLVKSKVDDEYRKSAASANKGVKFSKDRIEKMHGHRTSKSYSHSQSEKSKEKIGKKSKEKFTEEYRQRVRKTLVMNGKAVPDSEKDDFTIYKSHAEWIHRMWDIVEDSSLLETSGIFNSFTNKTGCVRDHKVSRFTGFNEGVFPEILRHPANCQLISHSDNSSKREKSSLDITTLFNNIKTYDKEWIEQDLIIDLIKRYETGERFVANNYRRD